MTENVLNDASRFTPVRIDILRANCPFTFDLYVKVADKFILYVRRGDDIEEERLQKFMQIQKLKEKNVDRLFLTVEDNEKLVDYVEKDLEEIIEDKNMPLDEQAQAAMEIVQNAVEVMFNDPTSVLAFKMADKAAKGLRKVVQNNPKALKQVFNKKGRQTDSVEAHCKSTATLALKLAFSIGYRGEDLDNLGAAALLHDVGHVNLKKEEQELLFKRPGERFSPDDKRIYSAHVNHGVQIVSNKPFVNPKIIELIQQHEEKLKGNGYPAQLEKLDLLSQILGICNQFDKRFSVQKMDVAAAFKDLQVSEMGNYDLKLFQKLRELLMAEDLFKE